MNFIPDKEISLQNAEEDKLGTKIYADTIEKIITEKNDDSPLTIGLFGGWGSGKSSIVRTVKDSLEVDGSIKTMIYDAWKYSNDAFRRSFILEFKKTFKLEISDDLKSFYNDKNEEIQHRVAFKKKWWIHLILWLPILTLFIWSTSYTTDLQIIISFLGLM